MHASGGVPTSCPLHACAGVLVGIEGLDSVCEATHGMHDRGRPIGHGVELVQPAWLEAGRHQQQVHTYNQGQPSFSGTLG